ncbi:MAG: peptidoglycan-binding protein [Acidimicrobiales bacterium]
MRRRSSLVVVTVVAVLAAAIGWFAGQQIESPSSAASRAQAPAPSRITVPVESRTLSQRVVVRGDAQLADSVQIKVDTAIAGGGPAIVTGVPVAEETQLTEGTVLLEVAERPVVVLHGELPMFRTLGLTSRGDDVAQLEASLARLGFDPGPQDALFDTATETAVRAWYSQLGYAPVTPTVTELERLRTAQAAVTAAQRALDAMGIGEAERLQLVGAIDDARAAAAEARAAGAPEAELIRLDRAVVIAEAQYAERVSGDRTDQRRALTEAEAELAVVRQQTGLRVPAAEVVFLRSMPRKLDQLLVQRGDVVGTSAVAEVSSASLRIVSALSAADRPLLSVGTKVRIEEEGLGIDLEGTVTELADEAGGTGVPKGKYAMIAEPATTDNMLPGVNVKLTAAVQSTAGDVLAVPLAALFATADGSARVEIEDSPDLPTRMVTVKTGLSADGYVEVRPLQGELAKGDRVVVGEQAGDGPAADDPGTDDAPAATEDTARNGQAEARGPLRRRAPVAVGS